MAQKTVVELHILRRLKPVVDLRILLLRTLSLVFLSGTLMLSASAVAIAKPLYLYAARMWRMENGLPQNVVKCIVRSPDGFLWIATQEGIGRFDGTRFTDYTTDNTPGLASNNVHELLFDRFGDLWVLAGGGLSECIGGRFRCLIPVQPGMDSVQHIWQSRSGEVLVACEHSLRRVDNGRMQIVAELLSPALRNTGTYDRPVEDASGSIWMPDVLGNLIRIDRSGAVSRIDARGAFLRQTSRGLSVDPSGTVWAGGDHGVFRIVDGAPVLVVAESRLDNRRIDRLTADKDGNLWILADSHLFSIPTDLASGAKVVVRHFGPADGAPDTVTSVDVDSAGKCWVLTTDGRRVYCYVDGKFEGRLLPEAICWAWTSPIFDDDPSTGVWIGTYGGLCALQPSECRTLGFEDDLPADNFHCICMDRRRMLWAGSDSSGVISFVDGVGSPVLDPLIIRQCVTTIAADPNDGIWAISNGRVYVIRSRKATDVTDVIGIPGGGSAQSAAFDTIGNLWLGTSAGLVEVTDASEMASARIAGNMARWPIRTFAGSPTGFLPVVYVDRHDGVWVGANKSLDHLQGGKFTHYDTFDGLPSVPIIAIYEDDRNTLWIGSWGEGLYRLSLDPSVGDAPAGTNKIARIGVDHGLYANSIQAIQQDNSGNLLIGSSKGVFRVSIDQLNAFAWGTRTRIECFPYTVFDGATGGVCSQGNQPVSCRDNTGAVWFAAQHGLERFDVMPENRRPSPIVIEAVAVAGRTYNRPVNSLDTSVNHGSEIIAPPADGSLNISFTALEYKHPDDVRFRCILSGFDSTWGQSSNRRDVHYTNLPPGRYQFKVTEVDANGAHIGAPATCDIELLPHWYETVWFRVAVVLMLVALGVAGSYWRLLQMAARNRDLEAKVAERTDELMTANAKMADAQEELVAQFEQLQSLQSELEAQNDELSDARDLLAKQNQELEGLAATDALTGLGNRRAFQDLFQHEFRSAVRYQVPLSLMMMDVDHFKQFNDTFGHQEGDRVLVAVAASIRSLARDTDVTARYGGEEFAVVLPHTDSYGAVALAERMREEISQLGGLSRTVTVSIGVSTLSPHVESHSTMIEQADKALYQSKRCGRNSVTHSNFLPGAVKPAGAG